MKQYIVNGMTCAACQTRVEKAVANVPGVTSCSVSLLTNSLGVEGDAKSADIIRAVEAAGYEASLKETGSATNRGSAKLALEEDALKDRETPILKRRLGWSIGFLLVLMYITMGHNMLNWPLPAFLIHNHLGLSIIQMLLTMAVMFINRKFFTNGFKALRQGSPNMDTLVALGTFISYAWSLFVVMKMTVMITQGEANADLMSLYHNELYFESAAMIPTLITVGKMLEAMSKGKTTDALKSLIRLAPKKAVLLKNNQEVEVAIDDVGVGDIFVVKPGESIPVDGVIIDGVSAIDESSLTGESIPADKTVGDPVSAATINHSGYIKVRATRVGEDTTLAQIIKMVSEASATKAPIAKIADKISGIFVPAVIAIALVVMIGWLLAGRTVPFALERAIAVLVISCPCALGLATPVAIMVGNGVGFKNGILFKTSESLEEIGKMQIVALDKTGTITAGKPKVTDLLPCKPYTKEDLLSLAYALESKSEHPLARAIVEKAQETAINKKEVTDFKSLTGSGLKAKYQGQTVHAGSYQFIKGLVGLETTYQETFDRLASQGKTPLFFEKAGELVGIIAVADVIKDDSAKAIKQIQKMGLSVIMLTGDNQQTANTIGREAGVDEVIAGVLPNEKEAVIRELQKRGKVVMVGDGINDAPALTRADIGIAIGAGTDVAIDSANIVLSNSKLIDVAAGIRLSRATMRNIHENLFWAFFYNVICIPLAAGLLHFQMNPMIGAAMMSLSSFSVCMNALRLNLFKPYDSSHDRQIRSKLLKINDEKENNKMIKTVKIEGMMCPHCEMTVNKALASLAGVEVISVDHQTGTAKIKLAKEVAVDSIKTAIEDKDYKFITLE